METFCLCSVRCGTLYIAAVNLVYGGASLGISTMALLDMEGTSSVVRSFAIKFSVNGDLVNFVSNNLEIIILLGITLSSLMSLTSLVAIFGAVKCKRKMLYPFAYFSSLCVLFTLFCNIVLILHFRQSDASLGIFIFCCNLGVFLFIYNIYKCLCVVTFIRILRELSEEIKRKEEIEEMKKSFFGKKKFFMCTDSHHY